MTIEEALSAIKNAVYGKDVRQAMHDGILQAEGGAGTVAKKAEASAKDSAESAKKAAESSKKSEIASKAIEGKADQAVTMARSANSKSDSTQLQLDEIVINGDSSVEAAQARVDINNISYATLKDRLDKEQQEVKAQLAHNANILKNQLGILNYFDYVVDGDWTPALKKAIDDLPSQGVIIIPSQITLKTPLVIEKNNVTIRGITKETNIYKDGNFVGITTLGAYVHLVDFKLIGVEGNGNDGIHLRGSRNSYANVHSNNHGGHGIRLGKLTADSSDSVNFWRLENITTLENGLDGVHIQQAEIGHDAPPDLTAGYFIGLDSRDNGGDGLFVGSSLNNTFIGMGAQHNGKLGIRVGLNSVGNQFYNPYVENNVGEIYGGMVLEEGSRQNLVIGERARLSYTTVTDNGESNTILTHDKDLKGQPLSFKSGVFATKQVISNSDVSGYWEMKQLENRDLEWVLGNTSANGNIILKHSGSGSTNFIIGDGGGIGVGSTSSKDLIRKVIKQPGTVNYGSIAPNSQKEATMPVEGAKTSHNAIASLANFPNGLSYNVYVSNDNLVTIRVTNHTENTINLGSVVTRVTVFG